VRTAPLINPVLGDGSRWFDIQREIRVAGFRAFTAERYYDERR